MTPLFAFGPVQWGILALIGVVLFGKNLPEIARSIGKAFSEFKNGLNGLETNFDLAGTKPAMRDSAALPSEPVRAPQRVAATAPKFEDAPASPAV